MTGVGAQPGTADAVHRNRDTADAQAAIAAA